MNILVTGGASFIGSHVCERLVAQGHAVVAVDNFDPFYDPEIKRQNIASLVDNEAFRLINADIRDLPTMEASLDQQGMGSIDVVIHLAAKAGVRPSIQDPLGYTQVNVDGTAAMLEIARRWGARSFIFGSSSSVYGNNLKVPFAEGDPVEQPISPYAATKRAGELLCHTYHHLFGISVICLRFFTVYGPRQRPDLAIHKFARLIAAGQPIPLYGDGSTERDYTYVDDIVQGIEGALRLVRSEGPVYEIINLGGSRTTSLKRLVELLGEVLGVNPEIEWHPPQPGDVERTYADVQKANMLLGYTPKVPIEEGIARFAEWMTQQQGGFTLS